MLSRKVVIMVMPIIAMAMGLALFIGALTVEAQTTTPGVPSTGAGGELGLNALILAASAFAVIIGALYLRREAAHRGDS